MQSTNPITQSYTSDFTRELYHQCIAVSRATDKKSDALRTKAYQKAREQSGLNSTHFQWLFREFLQIHSTESIDTFLDDAWTPILKTLISICTDPVETPQLKPEEPKIEKDNKKGFIMYTLLNGSVWIEAKLSEIHLKIELEEGKNPVSERLVRLYERAVESSHVKSQSNFRYTEIDSESQLLTKIENWVIEVMGVYRVQDLNQEDHNTLKAIAERVYGLLCKVGY
jgi:hypothetical protein